MKKIIIALMAAVALTSCATMKPTERVVLSAFSDYRQYSAEGFLISPSPYTYNFEGIGEIDIEVLPGKVMEEVPSLYSGGSTQKRLVYETIPYDELVAMAVKEAKSKGADALVSFSITTEKYATGQGMTYAVGQKYHIRGYCIKRK